MKARTASSHISSVSPEVMISPPMAPLTTTFHNSTAAAAEQTLLLQTTHGSKQTLQTSKKAATPTLTQDRKTENRLVRWREGHSELKVQTYDGGQEAGTASKVQSTPICTMTPEATGGVVVEGEGGRGLVKSLSFQPPSWPPTKMSRKAVVGSSNAVPRAWEGRPKHTQPLIGSEPVDALFTHTAGLSLSVLTHTHTHKLTLCNLERKKYINSLSNQIWTTCCRTSSMSPSRSCSNTFLLSSVRMTLTFLEALRHNYPSITTWNSHQCHISRKWWYSSCSSYDH